MKKSDVLKKQKLFDPFRADSENGWDRLGIPVFSAIRNSLVVLFYLLIFSGISFGEGYSSSPEKSAIIVLNDPPRENSDCYYDSFSQQNELDGIEDRFYNDSNAEELCLAQNGIGGRFFGNRRGTFFSESPLLGNPFSGNTPSFAGASSIRTSYYNWYDHSRRRTVPVKVYRPAALDARAPVILFSHGLGGSNERCSYLGEYWAYNGYVAVFITHFGSDESVWRGKLRPLNELKNAYESSWTGQSRAKDIQFVIGQLESLVEQGKDKLGSQLNLQRIGVAGYDLGAFASMLMAGQLPPEGGQPISDPRIRAIIAMSPPVQANRAPLTQVYSKIEIPCLFITGTQDDGIVGSTRASQRRIPFDRIGCNDQYLLTFQGTDHMIYAGHPFLSSTRNDAPFQVVISRMSTNFWNAYLKEDPNALSFLMSQNVSGLINGLGRIERKFYLREEMANATKPSLPETKTRVAKPPIESDGTEFYSAPVSPYRPGPVFSNGPRPLRNRGQIPSRPLPH